jgi:predicted transcriptional regulator
VRTLAELVHSQRAVEIAAAVMRGQGRIEDERPPVDLVDAIRDKLVDLSAHRSRHGQAVYFSPPSALAAEASAKLDPVLRPIRERKAKARLVGVNAAPALPFEPPALPPAPAPVVDLDVVRKRRARKEAPPTLPLPLVEAVPEAQQEVALELPIIVVPPGLTPAVPVEESVRLDGIVCLEDGAVVTHLRHYLKERFHMKPEQYRTKWGLPAEYPMVAPNHTRQGPRIPPLASIPVLRFSAE